MMMAKASASPLNTADPRIERLLAQSPAIAGGVPEGLDALLLGALAREAGKRRRVAPILHIARDGNRLATLEDAIKFFAPDVEVPELPRLGRRSLRPRGARTRKPSPAASARLPRSPPRKPDDHAPADRAHHRQRSTPARAAARLRRLDQHQARARQCRCHAGPDRALESLGYGRAGTVTDPGQYAVTRRHPRRLSAGRAAAPPRFLRRHAGIDPRLRPRHAAHRGARRERAASAHERGVARARGTPRASAPATWSCSAR